MKCIAHLCENEQSNSRFKTKKEFCRRCLNLSSPIEMKCNECEKIYSITVFRGSLKRYCSVRCQQRHAGRTRYREKKKVVSKKAIIEDMLLNGTYTKQQLIDKAKCTEKSFYQYIHILKSKHDISKDRNVTYTVRKTYEE